MDQVGLRGLYLVASSLVCLWPVFLLKSIFFICWVVVLVSEILFPVAASALKRVKPNSWPLLMLLVYSVYLFTTLTLPLAGKFAAGVLLLLGLCGLYRLKKQHYSLNKAEKWLLFSFALFSVVSIISFFYWPQTRSARMHLEDYVNFIMLVPLYLLLRQFVFKFKWLIGVLAMVAIMLGCVSIAQFIAMKYYGVTILAIGEVFWNRPSGSVNPMRYGNISLVLAVIPIVAMLLVRNKVLSLKFLLVLASVLGLVACFLTQSRGALLSIPVLTFLYGMYLYRAGHPRFLMALVAGAVLVVGVVSQQDRVQRSFSSIERYAQGDSRSPLGARFDMFKAAGILIKQSPVFGHGLNSYSPLATKIRKNTPGMSHEVGMWNNPHNEILQVMVEKGVIGLITLLLLFAAPGYLFWQALKNAGDSKAGQQVRFYAMSGLSLLVVYAVAGQSVALFEHDVFNHFFALMVLLFASQIRVIGYIGERAAENSDSGLP